ncbi:helix-turn-helix transcriptional regulator [Syntrophomonas wolfei]|uniref:helix-turn-helix transcriptional regulator n=1 Tax=Syntrophomonas wolfei TaxID=863 RepID=UPI0007747C41
MHILQFIREHNGEVSIANLEIETGFSARHLQRIFRNCVGIGPKLYCRIVRFRRAYKEILVGQDLTAIAHNRGFSDQSYFCREFKELSGFTPSEFRHLFSDVGFFQDQPYLKR